MPGELNLATFRHLVGTQFRVHVAPGTALEMELVELQLLRAAPVREGQALRREPFSLIFRGAKGVRFPQRTYEVEHMSFGTAEIFLVPIGPDEKGERYEAVFN